MARFYGMKIKNGEITLEDVPKLWKTITAKWLEDHAAAA